MKMLLSAVVLVSALTLGESLRKEMKKEEVKRVVRGYDAKDGQFPYVIALYDTGNYICTGSIISKTSILTAAHCVVRRGELRPVENLHAIAGVANRSSSKGVFIEFKDFKVHPEYDEQNSDLAILETTAPIKFNDRVKPICIANENIGSLLLSRVAAVGWGQTNRNMTIPELPDTVQYVYQRVTGNLKCQVLYFGRAVPSSGMCATSLLSGICGGDSGGPLVYKLKGAPVLVGMASYVNALTGCGHLLGPAVFTRISSYTKYIKDTATGDVCVA
ncbi:hypothetical protein JTE90_021975 [Oedothorax gibbosus]|uniref:Peptidase S1 domain-containing protein n=1 Tax=Oedothorax gibbosus TaxID=931172 RepID=A0AAV6U1V2_9ARAC|nr:hypothetical protein JTE90_021975 [Oedothorax gibbosus]